MAMVGGKALRRQRYVLAPRWIFTSGSYKKNREHILKIAVSNVPRTWNKTAGYCNAIPGPRLIILWVRSWRQRTVSRAKMDRNETWVRHMTPLGLFLALIMR